MAANLLIFRWRTTGRQEWKTQGAEETDRRECSTRGSRTAKRSIFLNFLISKLPSPKEEDLSKGILDATAMDSYRVEKRAMQKIVLPDEDGEVEAVPTSERGGRLDPELERLSEIIREFNDLFGVSDWDDHDRVGRLITESMPSKVAANKAFRNARQNSDKQNARIEHERVLVQVMTGVMKDDTKLFKEFMDNEGFRRWMSDKVFSIAYKKAGHNIEAAENRQSGMETPSQQGNGGAETVEP